MSESAPVPAPEAPAKAPPVDNEHIAPGSEPFSAETIAANKPKAPEAPPAPAPIPEAPPHPAETVDIAAQAAENIAKAVAMSSASEIPAIVPVGPPVPAAAPAPIPEESGADKVDRLKAEVAEARMALALAAQARDQAAMVVSRLEVELRRAVQALPTEEPAFIMVMNSASGVPHVIANPKAKK
jgi:hypothetical protein